jgi:hypothetical protein
MVCRVSNSNQKREGEGEGEGGREGDGRFKMVPIINVKGN